MRATWPTPQAAQYRESGAWAGRLVDRALDDAAREHPGRIAIVDRDRRLSYGELAATVDRTAAALAALGVRRGDVVSFQLPNWAEATIAYLATIRLGAVGNPITPIYRGREVEFILRQSRARVLVIPDSFRRFDYRAMVGDLRERTPDLEHVLVVGDPGEAGTAFADAVGAAGTAPTVERDAGDPALLLYTSGTEASPKGVIHSHDTLVYECQSIIDLYELSADDRVFMPSPLTHITGILYGLILPTMRRSSTARRCSSTAAGRCRRRCRLSRRRRGTPPSRRSTRPGCASAAVARRPVDRTRSRRPLGRRRAVRRCSPTGRRSSCASAATTSRSAGSVSRRLRGRDAHLELAWRWSGRSG